MGFELFASSNTTEDIGPTYGFYTLKLFTCGSFEAKNYSRRS